MEGKVAVLPDKIFKMADFGDIEFEEGELENNGDDNAAARKISAVSMNDQDDLEEGEIRETDSPVPTSTSSKVKALCSFYQKGVCTRAFKCQFLHLNPSGKGNYQMFDTPPLAKVNKTQNKGNQHWIQQSDCVGLVHPRWNDYSNQQIDRFGRKLRDGPQHEGGWLPPSIPGVSPPICFAEMPFHPWVRPDAQTKSRPGSIGDYRSYNERSRSFIKSPYKRSRARSYSRSRSPLSPRSFKKSRQHKLLRSVSRSSSSRSRSRSPGSCRKSRTSSPHLRSSRSHSPLSPRPRKKHRTRTLSSTHSRSFSSSSRSPSPSRLKSSLRSKSRSQSQSSRNSRSCSESTSPSPHRPSSCRKSKSCRKSRHRSKSCSGSSRSSSPLMPRSCLKSRSRSFSRSRSRSSSVSSTSSEGSCSSSSSTHSDCSADDILRNSDFDRAASTEQHRRDDACEQLSGLPASLDVPTDVTALPSSCTTKLNSSSPDSGLSSDVSTLASSCTTKRSSAPTDSGSSSPGVSASSINIITSSQIIPASHPGSSAEGESKDREHKLCVYQPPILESSTVVESVRNPTNKPSKEDLLKKLDRVNAKIAKMKAKKTGQ